MASNHKSVATQKRERTIPNIKEVQSQEISRTGARRNLRSSGIKTYQQLPKDTASHAQHFNKENCPNPLKTRKRIREAEVEQTSKRPKRLQQPVGQQTLPNKQSKARKRPREALDLAPKNLSEPPRKRTRRTPRNGVVGASIDKEELNQAEEESDPIRYWTKTHYWPKGYAKQHDDNDSMSHLLARQKSSNSLRRKRSEPASVVPSSTTPSSTTPSDQKPREVKSTPYQDTRYETLLATKGSFMGKHTLGITQICKESYLNLLDAKQTVPRDLLFCDELFEETCEMIRNKNEARVIRDISQLIVPSAEILAARGAKSLKVLAESVNEGWNNSLPLTGTRPQPDYSVGFKREAFTQDQLDKLAPFIGDFITGDQSYFMATYYMYFPFLTCEVKCGAAALDIADRQNAHSMTLAVRAIVELFRLVGREMELHREILAFSISHDHRSVRIYGHYPVIDGKDTKYYRHPIRTFDFTELEGKEKWTAYKFTKNVYDTWMPAHFKRLCSVVDKIPEDLDFSVPQFSQSFGLSQDLERHRLSESTDPESQLRGSSHQSIVDDAGDTTPNTSFTGQDQGASKRPRPRRKPAAPEQQ